MIRWVLLLSRQGKVRLAKWYTTATQKERGKVTKEVSAMVLARPLKLCNFIDWKDQRVVYRRYASLYFVCGVDPGEATARAAGGPSGGPLGASRLAPHSSCLVLKCLSSSDAACAAAPAPMFATH